MENEIQHNGVPGGMRPIVQTMSLEDMAEDKALEVIEVFLRQMLHQVCKNHDTTSKSVFNTFNAGRFLGACVELQNYVTKQFGEG